MSDLSPNQAASASPHRWAVALACATFPLLWVGGLVTTTKAGMAVPDWPNTFGYNLFLYPWTTWWAGPWDIFVEHGHRLFAAAVGLLTMGLVVAVWRHDQRLWIRCLAAAALVLVVFQGSLGGLRVIRNERSLAMIHGFTGPLFFALATAIAVFTSKRWHSPVDRDATLADPHAGNIRRLAVVTCVLAYLQIVLGAVLRHVPVEAEPATFALAVRFHLVMAGILSLHVLFLVWSIARHFRRVRPIGRLAGILGALLIAQLALGAATWMVKYSTPVWAEAWLPFGSSGSAIVDGSWLQTHVVTGHVAVGSLLLATTLTLALYSLRLLGRPVSGPATAVRRWEAAV